MSLREFLIPKPTVLSVEAMAEELEGYDVISFDVFDTLLFRTCEKPTALFYDVEEAGFSDYYRLRVEAEQAARKVLWNKEKTREVNFAEIREQLKKTLGSEAEQAMQLEWNLEQKCCVANPYMARVTELLKKSRKRLVVTSDMYLGEKEIRQLLQIVGYEPFDMYYVSSEYRVSKSEGSLYEKVRQNETEQCKKMQKDKEKVLSFVHIGDNYHSDVKQAKRHDFKSYYYQRENKHG